jgi:hypothetical protein
MENPLLTFCFCLVTLFVYVFLIVKHKTILMGFTFMAVLQIGLFTLSYFFISFLFGLDAGEFGYYHFYVYNYMNAGLLAMALGIWVAWKPLRENMQTVNPFIAEPGLIYLFAVLGVVAVFISVVMPNIPTLSAIILQFYGFLPISLIAGLVLWRATHFYKPLLFCVCLFLPTGILFLAASGHVSILGAFLLHPMLVLCFWRRPQFYHFGFMFAWLTTYFIVGGVWLNARLLLRSGEIKGSAIEKAVQFFPQFAQQIFSFESFKAESIQQAAKYRLDLSSFQVAQAAYMPGGHPYELGKGIFIDPFAAIVPRFLWPSKPFTMGDNEHINKYTGATFSQDSISVDTVVAFDFYANFGWIGVIVGLFVFGYVAAKLELKLFTRGISLRQVIMFTIILLSLAGGGRRVSVMAMQIGAAVVGSYLLAEFLRVTGLFRTEFNQRVNFSMFKAKSFNAANRGSSPPSDPFMPARRPFPNRRPPRLL